VHQWVSDAGQEHRSANGKRKDKATGLVDVETFVALHGESAEIWLRAWLAGEKVHGLAHCGQSVRLDDEYRITQLLILLEKSRKKCILCQRSSVT